MNYHDALTITEDLRTKIEPVCEAGYAWIGGSLRRHKQDVHDGEIVAIPNMKLPTVEFGQLQMYQTPVEKYLAEWEREGRLCRVKGGKRTLQYEVATSFYGMDTLNPFKVEFYLITPPAQWGVGLVIRTGPGIPEDNFSQYCVTPRSSRGALPDGYRVKHLAVWNADQLDAKGEPLKGESPIPMPNEIDFLDFLGLGWIEPEFRHARWNHR